MTKDEILAQLQSLSAAERLKIVELTVHQLRRDLEHSSVKSLDEIDAQLARAARELLNDYSADKELTTFTALDGEAFHA